MEYTRLRLDDDGDDDDDGVWYAILLVWSSSSLLFSSLLFSSLLFSFVWLIWVREFEKFKFPANRNETKETKKGKTEGETEETKTLIEGIHTVTEEAW